MRSLLGLAAGLLLVTAAEANRAPVPEVKLSPASAEYAIAIEALGAMLESDYFRAPQGTFVSGNTCRMRFDFLDKGRLSASCY